MSVPWCSFCHMAKMTVGSIVSDRRDQLGLTQAELAQTIGVCSRTIIRLESGQLCSFINIAKVAKALDLSLDDLARQVA